MHLYLIPLALLAQFTIASLSIDDICYYQLPTKTESIICLRADQPLDKFPKEVSATAALGATGGVTVFFDLPLLFLPFSPANRRN